MNDDHSTDGSVVSLVNGYLGVKSGLKLILPALFKPWSAFIEVADKKSSRRIALFPLIVVALMQFLFIIQVILYIFHKKVIDGDIVLLPGTTEETYYYSFYTATLLSTISAVVIVWMGVAAISYFVCRLMNYQLNFGQLLTLSSFSLLPTAISMSIGTTILIFLGPEVLFAWANTIQLFAIMNGTIIIWESIILMYILVNLADINTKRAFIVGIISSVIPHLIGLLSIA